MGKAKRHQALSWEDRFLGFRINLEGMYNLNHEGIEETRSKTKNAFGHMIDRGIDESVYSLIAESPDKKQNIVVIFRQISLSEAEEIMERGTSAFMGDAIDDMRMLYLASGFEDAELSVCTQRVDDKDYSCIKTFYNDHGQPVYSRQIWIVREGWLNIIAVNSAGTDATEELFQRVGHLKEEDE